MGLRGVYMYMYIVFSATQVFIENITSWTVEDWEFGEGEVEIWKWDEEVIRAYPICVPS